MMNSQAIEYGVNTAMMSQSLSERIMASDAERSLNFGTSHCEDYDTPFAKKPKTIRDPMSHRIIEKRRRDRMNNCLADLSRLIPNNYLKQGQGRIEKTEIIEMAIRHIKNLTNVVNKHGVTSLTSSLPDRYLGFKECQDEVMRYLVEVEGWDAHNKLCNRMMHHLEQSGEKFRIMNDDSLSQAAKEEQYRHVEDEISAEQDIQPMTMETPPDTGQGMNDFNLVSPQVHHQFQSPVQQRPTEPTPTHSPKREMETSAPPPPFGGLEALASAQQITQEHLKHDKHLWSLLASKYEEMKMNMEDSSSPYPSSNSSNKTDSGIKCSSRGSDMCQVTVDSLCQNSNVESCSEKNDGNVYKFKHNITKRFSEEGKKMEVSDFSSSSSSDNMKKRLKPVFRHARMRSPSSMMSSQYSSSDKNGSSLTGESASCINIDIKPASPLPGFVLHPNGTHYIPMSIHPSNLGCDLFERNKHERCRVFHPISIPVNFSGPLLYLRRIKERKSELNRQDDSRSGSAESQSVGVSSVESSGVSDNSPPPNVELNG